MDEKQYVEKQIDRSILKSAQRSRKVTQDVIAERIGIKRNSLCQNMSRPRMSLGMFAKILSALDYDVVVVDRQTGEEKWMLFVPERDMDDDI